MDVAHHAEHVTSLAADKLTVVASCCRMHEHVRKFSLEQMGEIDRDEAFFLFLTVSLDFFRFRKLPLTLLVGILFKHLTKALLHNIKVHRVEQHSRANIHVADPRYLALLWVKHADLVLCKDYETIELYIQCNFVSLDESDENEVLLPKNFRALALI